MGEIACIAGDFALATIEFQWIGEQTSTTEIKLTSIQLADGHGNIIEGTTTTLSVNGGDAIPLEFALYQNYPNPFNPVTQIRFDLADASNVRLVIFNLLGQEVRTLVAANMPAGAHQIAWDGRDDRGLNVGSGLYLYKLQAGNFVNCRKMFLMR
jgi:flagellar hook assembly protein FlgD